MLESAIFAIGKQEPRFIKTRVQRDAVGDLELFERSAFRTERLQQLTFRTKNVDDVRTITHGGNDATVRGHGYRRHAFEGAFDGLFRRVFDFQDQLTVQGQFNHPLFYHVSAVEIFHPVFLPNAQGVHPFKFRRQTAQKFSVLGEHTNGPGIIGRNVDVSRLADRHPAMGRSKELAIRHRAPTRHRFVEVHAIAGLHRRADIVTGFLPMLRMSWQVNAEGDRR